MPRLRSAIASTIFSLCSAVSLVGVDQAQAAQLTYNFDAEGKASGSFKVDNSLLTGIGYENIAVSEGRLDTYLNLTYNYYLGEAAKKYYNLVGSTVLFYQGDFRGLRAYGNDDVTREYISDPDEPGEPYSFKYSGSAAWSMDTDGWSSDSWISYFSGYYQIINGSGDRVNFGIVYDTPVSYTLVDTEPVPEPLTAGGTALALAGLSWLKNKKKMAA